MSRRRMRRSIDATLGWGRLMARTNEMWQEAGLVMHARLLSPPSASALVGMGTEKVDAGMEAFSGMTRALTRMSMGRPPTVEDWLTFYRSAITPYHRRVVRNAESIRKAATPRTRQR